MPEEVRESISLSNAGLLLRVEMKAGGMCQFSYGEDGNDFRNIGQPFQAVEGKWIGAKVGLFAHKNSETGQYGYADYDWFRIE